MQQQKQCSVTVSTYEQKRIGMLYEDESPEQSQTLIPQCSTDETLAPETGFKVWCLNSRLGHLIQCEPYQGASGSYDANLRLGGSVVTNLMENVPTGVPCTNCSLKMFSPPLVFWTT